MSSTSTDATATIDPAVDLVIERDLDASPAQVWAALTTTELIERWFAPAPWSVSRAEVDASAGGAFHVVMRSPEGEDVDGGAGCVLEAVPERRLVWTSALGPGFQPLTGDDMAFTAVVSMEPAGEGTRYTVTARHATAESAARHAEMGFAEGWGQCADQLGEVALGL